MDFLEEVLVWLRGFAGLEDLAVDSLAPAPGSAGLFPLGVEQTDRKADVLGNVTHHLRCTFLLRRRELRQAEAARWLLAFQDWVRSQSHQGLAPKPGMDSHVRAEAGKLAGSKQPGTATYEVKIIFTFTKKESEHGEN